MLNNMGESNNRDIDEMVAELGYKAPLITAQLSTHMEHYIEKPRHLDKGINDLPNFKVYYSTNDLAPPPKWAQDYAHSKLDSGQLNYDSYQHQMKMVATHNHRLTKAMDAVERVLAVPGNETWRQLPQDHPLKSDQHVTLAQSAMDKVLQVRNELNKDVVDYEKVKQLYSAIENSIASYNKQKEDLLEYSINLKGVSSEQINATGLHLMDILSLGKQLDDTSFSITLLDTYQKDHAKHQQLLRSHDSDVSMHQDIQVIGRALRANNVGLPTDDSRVVTAGFVAPNPTRQV